ncbi:MAG: GMC family oxidoreductase [Actinomycetes bacterium]
MADYVVVGGGSAGAVLAARLSEDPATSVTLIEAGAAPKQMEAGIPAAFSKLFKGPLDWDLSTVPQPSLDGRELYWPRGRALGGSSVINAMMWVRGHRADYDAWRDAGCDGWGYDDVLPYFQRAEHRSPDAGDGAHGTSGPLHIQDHRDPNVSTAAFLAACAEIGLERKPHHNTGDNEGFAPTIVNEKRGKRWSTYDGYLKPAMRRSNLEVLTGLVVDRVVVEAGRAVAVRCVDEHGHERIVAAEREVVVTAGAVASPAILQRSGIGDPAHLAEHGIDVVVAAPEVGRNLVDHIMCAIVVSCPEPVTLVDAEKPIQLAKYLLLRKGLLTSNVGEAAAFIRTALDLPAPDVEVIFGPVPYIDHGLIDWDPGHGLAVGPVLVQPASRGEVAITGSDPGAPLRIDPRYFSAPGDLAAMTAGVRMARRLLDTDAMRRFVGPDIEGPADDSDAAIAAFLAAQAETLYHPAGTCRMGADAESVVDPALRVRGVTGLRVADVSIMPSINRGHTHAPAVMIGERAADLVRKDR